jgi:ABC-type transporter Mla MlaB component
MGAQMTEAAVQRMGHIDTSSIPLQDLEQVDSAALQKALLRILTQQEESVPAAGFDSAIELHDGGPIPASDPTM